MFIFSSYLIVLLNIIGLVLTNPVEEVLLNESSENISIAQAFHDAEKALKHYSYLMNSDIDYLAHGLLHVLLKDPTSVSFIPRRAMDIAFKNVAKKMGYDEIDIITTPILLTIEQNYQKNLHQPSKIQITDETKEKIEEALDKFLDGVEFRRHL